MPRTATARKDRAHLLALLDRTAAPIRSPRPPISPGPIGGTS